MNKMMMLGMFLLLSMVAYSQNKPQHGIASYYHDSLEGGKTASGETFSQNYWTAAHKTLPFDTWVKVRDKKGREVVVRINDRLPQNSSRSIDLTLTAAEHLGMVQDGLRRVTITVITPRDAWTWFQQNFFWNPFLFYPKW